MLLLMVMIWMHGLKYRSREYVEILTVIICGHSYKTVYNDDAIAFLCELTFVHTYFIDR